MFQPTDGTSALDYATSEGWEFIQHKSGGLLDNLVSFRTFIVYIPYSTNKKTGWA